jgi:hypothetical protein
MFAEQLLQITRRTPGLAAGVMTASISLSTAVYSQGESTSKLAPQTVSLNEKKSDAVPPANPRPETKVEMLGGISGTVTDPNRAVIPGVRVTILGVLAGKNETTTTNGDGVYRFENLLPGNYRIEWEATSGFQKGEKEVSVSAAQKQTSDAALGLAQIEVTVDVVADIDAQVSIQGGGSIVIEYSLPLNEAVANSDVKKVRRLLRQGADVNGQDEKQDKMTPLFVAVEHGNLEILRLLLDHGASANTTDEDGDSALIIAAEYSSAEALRALIDAGADVNLANKEGRTALMAAAMDDKLASVELLLSFGAFVNARNSDGSSAWDLTSDKDVRALLERFGAERTVEENVPASAPESTDAATPDAMMEPTAETPSDPPAEATPESTPGGGM